MASGYGAYIAGKAGNWREAFKLGTIATVLTVLTAVTAGKGLAGAAKKGTGAAGIGAAEEAAASKGTWKGPTDRSDQSGAIMVDSAKSKSGVTPPPHEAQVDHIVPIDRGGTHAMDNLRLLTRLENRTKWNK